MKVEKPEKLKVCYLSDIAERVGNVKKILLFLERGNITEIKDNYFSTNNAVYLFVNCIKTERTKGILADQVIIDYREPMRTIAVDMLRESCVPEQYQIIDDREIGARGY